MSVGSNRRESIWSAGLRREKGERLRHEMPEDEEATGEGGWGAVMLSEHGAPWPAGEAGTIDGDAGDVGSYSSVVLQNGAGRGDGGLLRSSEVIESVSA